MSNRCGVPDGCETEPRAAGERAATTRVLVVDDDAAACALTRDALRPHVIVVGAALAEALGAVLRDGALAATRVIALSSGGERPPVADVILRTPVDALELLATVRLLAASAARDDD
jgi:hypothetical protein